MEIVLTALILILAIVGFIAVVIRIFNDLKIVFDKIKIKQKRIADIDILNNNVRNNRNSIGKTNKKINKLESRLGIVEFLANDFNRDMDRYHTSINKDIDERMKAFAGRITKLEEANKECYKLHLLHAKMISALEKKAKIHHISLRAIDDFMEKARK